MMRISVLFHCKYKNCVYSDLTDVQCDSDVTPRRDLSSSGHICRKRSIGGKLCKGPSAGPLTVHWKDELPLARLEGKMSDHISQETFASNNQVVGAPQEYQTAPNEGQETAADTTMAEGALGMPKFGAKRIPVWPKSSRINERRPSNWRSVP